MSETYFLFSYGAILSSETRIKRNINPIQIIPVYLPNFILVFNTYGNEYSNDKTFANIYPKNKVENKILKKSICIHGIIIEITKRDLIMMDKFENGYDRYHLEDDIFNYKNEKITQNVQVYYSEYFRDNWENQLEILPSKRYLNLLYNGSVESNLNQEYIKFLKQFLEKVE
eukprot:gene3485-6134_t